jgi:leader peptidase (prepilin peptidase) / N-methyltransferase
MENNTLSQLSWELSFLHGGILICLAFLLMMIAHTDWKKFIIPNRFLGYLLGLGIFWQFFSSAPWNESLSGALLSGIVALALKYTLGVLLKREALGWGDVKLMAIGGLWVGLSALPLFWITGGLLGILAAIPGWRNKKEYFPLGPALCGAIAVCLL